MAIKIKKRARGKRQRRTNDSMQLLTIKRPGADPNEVCDCPICRAFGVDPNAGAVQAKQIDRVEDQMLLAALMEQMNGGGGPRS